MDRVELTQNADFLSIALEEIGANSFDGAQEFVADVRDNLRNHGRDDDADRLQHAIEYLEDGRHEDAREIVGDVQDDLLDDLDGKS